LRSSFDDHFSFSQAKACGYRFASLLSLHPGPIRRMKKEKETILFLRNLLFSRRGGVPSRAPREAINLTVSKGLSRVKV